ncbi:MAG: NAD-dependent dehydratase [Candidatus Harrisonbacteria bacterium CG10_big_fil_rev_8_21_14_0_10_45_28]|uniref:NAD-dependent dehydratase n=1 Tax=Candidatus Harrisonbacteria bacterium CG10_big_fil_rev_8_21_14_0_10_45_28 TaxID=1974586 RepID=A0A2H0UQ53_9BACT|nr:MAG: NAD-dependent dehydratase [Candidatus Harrisonbacteria bacterium CG10_big_fil_rev_8_21_14_0_10_45_28]
MPRKILITGATGFVGSNLARKLLSLGKGEEIHILTRTNSNLWRISDILEKIHNYSVDLLEEEKLKKILESIKPDYIFHLATAGIHGGVSASDRELVETNLIGLINLISALKDVNYKGFINVGSSSEYGLKDKPMKEMDLCEPMNAYGIIKLAATHYAGFIAKSQNKPIIAFRLFSPFGSYDDHRRLISKVILDLLNNRELNLAKSEAVRDYIYIEDVIDLFLEAMDKADSLKGEVFNVGMGKEHKISEAVDLIAASINSKAKINWGTTPSQPWEPKKWEADMSKTFSAFKWRPEHSFREGIEKTINWFKENKNLYGQFFHNG